MSFPDLDRFSEQHDPEPADRPSLDEYADLTVVPPCGGPCPPEGCFSERCWVDADREDGER